MQTLEVGKPFPIRNPAGKGDHVTAFVAGESFDVICWAGDLNSKEVQAWRRGLLRYGAYVKNAIPFFLLYFPELKWPLDVSINIHAEKEGGRPFEQYLEGQGNAVNLYLVDAATGLIKGMRMIGLDPVIADAIRLGCANQLQRYPSAAATSMQMEDILSAMTTLEMIGATQMIDLPSR